ncbi:hypothetical protein Tco_0168059 [Tanacetum coccineum]
MFIAGEPKNVGSSKKAKIVESKNANHSEPNHTWGSNATDIPPSYFLVMTGSPDCSLRQRLKTGYGIFIYLISTSVLKQLAKDGLARGILRLKFQKDHLCSTCALGKSKKSSHQPKAKDTNQEKLYLLHMDLCGPMHVASINGKSSGPRLHSMTPATSSSGLVPNTVSQQPCIPPNRDDLGSLMFSNLCSMNTLIPPSICVFSVQEATALSLFVSESPVSTSID